MEIQQLKFCKFWSIRVENHSAHQGFDTLVYCRFIYHQGRLAGGFDDGAPECAFGVDAVFLRNGQLGGDMNEMVIIEGDQHRCFSCHCGVYGISAELGTVN